MPGSDDLWVLKIKDVVQRGAPTPLYINDKGRPQAIVSWVNDSERHPLRIVYWEKNGNDAPIYWVVNRDSHRPFGSEAGADPVAEDGLECVKPLSESEQADPRGGATPNW